MLSLPRVLWELGRGSQETAHALVSALSQVGRRGLRSADGSQAMLDKLQPRLSLYFFAVSKGRSVFGPFVEVRTRTETSARRRRGNVRAE